MPALASKRLRCSLAIALSLAAVPASAITIGPNYCLPGSTSTNCLMQFDIPGEALATAGLPGPYVGISAFIMDSNTLRFSLQSLTQTSGANTYKYYFGDVAFDMLGAITNPVFVSATNRTGASVGPSGFTFGGALPQGGFHSSPGQFGDTSVNTPNGFNKAISSLVFTLDWSAPPGGGFTDLLTQQFMELGEHGSLTQGAGASAAGHIYTGKLVNGSFVDAQITGPAAWPNCTDQRVRGCLETTQVPEPASLALLATGLIGIGLIRRRRHQHIGSAV